jgi:hypothetical protein
MQPEGSEAHAPSSSTVDSQAAAVASAAAAEGSEANHARPQWLAPQQRSVLSRKNHASRFTSRSGMGDEQRYAHGP